MINGHIFTEKLGTHHGKVYQTVIDDPPHGTTAGLCNVIDRHGTSIISAATRYPSAFANLS